MLVLTINLTLGVGGFKLNDILSTSSHEIDAKLKDTIELIYQTEKGRQFKPHIDELLNQQAIHLAALKPGHYGESGEGCIIVSGEYVYEGLYIDLNESLSVPELASALVHEIMHYRMIKHMVDHPYGQPMPVSKFEIAAFAVQYQFMTELENLDLANRKIMFVNDTQSIIDIMFSAHQLIKNWSDLKFQMVVSQLIEFGYPESELNRTIIKKNETECVGRVS